LLIKLLISAPFTRIWSVWVTQMIRALLRRSAWKIWPIALRWLEVIGTDTDRSSPRMTSYVNHGPILYCFRDKRRFQSRIANLSRLRSLVSAHGVKITRTMALPGKKEVWWYLQPSGYNTRTWPVASPASGHVGTCPPGVWEIFFATLKQVVWFGLVGPTMPNSNSALFVQP